MKITITQGIDPLYYEKQTSQANESDSASDATAVSSAAGSTTSTDAATNADGMTFAETLQAIDQAIADAKASGQSGLDPNSAAAKALGIMAYSTSYAYASLVNNTSASTTYNEALTTLTNRYSNYSREDMGYKGDSASDYGGDLACSDELNAYFDEAAKTYNVDVKLLKSVAKAESGFNASAVSSAGAVGIMQLMPSTASGLGVTDSYDAYQNIMGGAKYLAALLDTFDGNASYAVAGYNAGGSKVTQYGGIPPYAETQKYVVKVLGYYEGVSYSADATSAGSYSTISASGSSSASSSTSSSTTSTSSSLTAEEIQDMIEKAVSSALASALYSTISDTLASAISSSVSSTIQSAVESSMSEIATETIGEWLNTEVEKTMREILAEQEAAAADDTTATEDTSSEEVTTSAIEDVPVAAPLATEEEETEDSLAINAVTGTETGTSSDAGAEAESNGSQQ